MTLRPLLILTIAALVAACVDPPGSRDEPPFTTTTDDPLIGGTKLSDPTRVVVINIPPAGTCTGIMLTETSILTAFHCIKTGVPPLTTVTHAVGPIIETSTVLTADLDPLRLFVSTVEPQWEHDIAVLHVDPPLTIPVGARDALLDEGTATPTDPVECVGGGSVVPGSGPASTTGTLYSLTFPITTGSTSKHLFLKGFPAKTSQPGDSGGPCWSTTSHRIVGIMQAYDTSTYVNFLARTDGATAVWISAQAFKTDMFDASSSQTFATTPAQWRIAKLDSGTGKQIVGITSGGLEIYGGSHSPGAPITFSPKTTVSLTAVPFSFASPDARFTDVTGDGLTDLVMPTASEIDVLPAAGGLAFTFPAKRNSLGSSTWLPDGARFANVDGLFGKDYVWMDTTGVWVGVASSLGSFGAPTKQLSWTFPGGSPDFVQLDPTPGIDLGILGSTEVLTYSALGLGALSSVPVHSPLPPGDSWELYSGFLSVDHKVPNDPFDWVAVRGPSLVTQLNNLAGKFVTPNTTPVEVASGWDANSTMIDLNNDNSADWIGIDDKYIYVKPASAPAGSAA